MNKKEELDINQRHHQTPYTPEFIRTSSMTTLILWNINKALEKKPDLEIKAALKKAQEDLDKEQVNVSAIVRQQPDERHLSCALLAWQQLGHNNADSLYSFMTEQKKVRSKPPINKPMMWGTFGVCKKTCNMSMPRNMSEESSFIAHKESDYVQSPGSCSIVSSSYMGPVLKLPVTPKRVVPVYCMQGERPRSGGCGGLRKTGQDIKNRIEMACCLQSACVEKLATVDKETKELRQRLGKLAKREAERIELLERAEIAWRDLEMGYMRRHRSCIDKEEDIVRQSTKLIEERNTNKELCVKLVEVLKPRGDVAEKARETLKKLEADVCEVACGRLKQAEMLSKEEAILAEIQTKSNQQDRDLLFKEEKARRKKTTTESELESIRGLLYEEERTLKAELKAFKDQLKQVSTELFGEDKAIEENKQERDKLLQEKRELTEDLEGCQNKCDRNMQKRIDELNEKKLKLKELKEQVLECTCKFPMDTSVQVKRTPSFAALCYCSPEDRVCRSCSCTSLRSRLLSDLFTSLFEGLQAEMCETSIKMPCQLLKCLEDSHNWDRPSVTKSNLRSFFAKMLCGELDIAIINSIERYHAKWVGVSCADIARTIPDDSKFEGWEDRALAQKARWMAEAMAEEMFNKKVDDIMQQAKKVVTSAPPPCTCKPPENTSVFQCLLEPVKFTKLSDVPPNLHTQSNKIGPTINITPEIKTVPENEITQTIVSVSTNTPKKKHIRAKSPLQIKKESEMKINRRTCWQCNKSDVVLLRAQIEDLKKESLKKQDLKLIEQTIKKLVQRASGPDAPTELYPDEVQSSSPVIANKKTVTLSKLSKTTKDNAKTKRKVENVQCPKIKRQYAVNMCFCGLHRSTTKPGNRKPDEATDESLTASKHETSRDIISLISMRQSKPIDQMHSEETKQSDTKSYLNIQPERKMTCGSNCACFNKIPSCSSIDKFLDTLVKWNCDINVLPEVSNNILVDSATNSRKITESITCEQKPVTCLQSNDMPIDMSGNNDMSAIVCHSTVTTGGLQTTIELNKLNKIDNDYINERNFQLPATTVSEYMGAVNLEKSNENFCKSITTDKEDIQNNAELKDDLQDNISFHAFKFNISEIKSTDSHQRRKIKSEEYSQKKEEIENQRKTKSQEIYDKKKIKDRKENLSFLSRTHTNKVSPSFKSVTQDKTILQEKSNPYPILMVDENYNQLKKRNSKNNKKQESLNLRKDCSLNTSNHFTCDCEHQIKLLGVTLANVNPRSNVTNTSNVQVIERNASTKIAKSLEENIYSSLNSFPVKSMDYCGLLNLEQSNTNAIGLPQPFCQCNIKFDELKGLLNDVYKDKIDASKDKRLDSNSTKNYLKEESCVCCDKLIDQSNELEVNMFHLLKDHLRKKLEVLKNTCRSSYCMKPEEEDEVVATIFKKIKQTITESTGKIICKCSEEASNEGSWQRAYNLLQEYLKIKISRVQCNCSSPNQKNQQTILPELTDKVCLLIEKDFERLKDICKRKSVEKSDSNKLNEEIKFQMPEKDVEENKIKNICETESVSLKKGSIIDELSKCYVISTCNTSAQVIPNFETKSCEALKMDTYDKSTVETQSSNIECLKNTCSVDCNIFDSKKILKFSIDNEQALTPTTKELEIELKDDIFDKTNYLPVPYIGYTMDCTCTPNLGTCVCSRSRVFKNSDVISKLWSSYTGNDKKYQEFSYIMENIMKNKEIVTNPQNLYENDLLKTISKDIARIDIHTNTQKMGIITLKDSWDKSNKQWKQSSTNTDDNDIFSLRSDLSNNESEAVKNELIEQKKKSVHFLHRSKSEIITTEALKLELISQKCDCRKVPVCHIKMLVENIETRLANSECTCDSLSSKVCPIHSKIDS